MLVAGLVAGSILTFAITYPGPSSVGTFTSVSTTTDTVTAISVSTTTTTSTITTTPAVNLTAALADAYLSHIGAIESQNATALASQYYTNATLLLSKPAPPSACVLEVCVSVSNPTDNTTYDGSGNITRFYAENPCSICFLADGAQFPASNAVANETYSIAMSNSTLKTATVTSHFILYGYASGVCCYTSGTTAYYYDLEFHLSYVLQGGHWLISTESQAVAGMSYCAATTLSPDGSVFTCRGTSS